MVDRITFRISFPKLKVCAVIVTIEMELLECSKRNKMHSVRILPRAHQLLEFVMNFGDGIMIENWVEHLLLNNEALVAILEDPF